MARKRRKQKTQDNDESAGEPISEQRSLPRLVILGAMAIMLLLLGVTIGVVIEVVMQPAPAPTLTSAPRDTIRPRPDAPPKIINAPKPSSFFDEGGADNSSAEPIRNFTPLTLFAVPSDAPEDWPVVAIVIDDMGLDRNRGGRVAALPGPLTLSFLTYADGLNGQADAARDAGHEVMAHVPMEPIGSADPGPGALISGTTAADIKARLDAYLDGWSGYVGINNHMGSRLTADRAAMDVVMVDLRDRGLMWLDSRTGTETLGEERAAAFGVPHLARDIFLDNEDERSAIDDQLRKVEAVARSQGYAVAIGHPRDMTIQALAAWLPSLDGKGIALVPVTEAVRRKSR
jgi:polysaccharide deacetylase 2 family uncharacterized protein YibQ